MFAEELYIRKQMLIWLQQNSDKHNLKLFEILPDYTGGEKIQSAKRIQGSPVQFSDIIFRESYLL
jgi:hypothetical protein